VGLFITTEKRLHQPGRLEKAGTRVGLRKKKNFSTGFVGVPGGKRRGRKTADPHGLREDKPRLQRVSSPAKVAKGSTFLHK